MRYLEKDVILVWLYKAIKRETRARDRITHWLIRTISKDSEVEGLSVNSLRTIYKKRTHSSMANVLFVVCLFSVPLIVEGSMRDKISRFFGGGQVFAPKVTASVYNAQTLPLLRGVSNIDPNPSKGGGDISVISGSALASDIGPSGVLSEVNEIPQTDQISLYIVREGDALSQIAEMFGVSTNTIRWANEISANGHIRPGQELLILPISGVRHTIKKGDTLKSIAKRYEGDIEEILAYNSLSEDSALSVGEIITVPGGIVPQVRATTRVSGSVASGASSSYSGYFIHPSPGSIRTQGIHGYNAVDFGARLGSPILASASGRVIVSRSGGWNGGYGTYIVIEHPNGTQTLYAHNNSNIVYGGQQVVAGQVIGYVGSTGRSTGPHLHFEVRGARNPF